MKEQYRLLNHGEMMQMGDEFYDRDNTWEQVYPTEACVPKEWDEDTMHPTRRKEIVYTAKEVKWHLMNQKRNCRSALRSVLWKHDQTPEEYERWAIASKAVLEAPFTPPFLKEVQP